jgi:hypothetical protein
MLPNELPRCLCGADNWVGWGGSFGGLNQSNYKCGTCSRYTSFLCNQGGNVLLMMKTPGVGLSEPVRNWFDGTIQGVWRDNHKRFEERVESLSALLKTSSSPQERNVTALELADRGAGGPLAAQVFDLLVDPTTEGHRGTLLYSLLLTMGQWDPADRPRTLDEKTNRFVEDETAPDRIELLIKLSEDNCIEVKTHAKHILEALEERKKNKEHCYYTSGHAQAPIPPRIPGDEVAVWVLRGRGAERKFRSVDPAETQELPVPPDPIRVYHDALFAEIFAAVGLTNAERREIPNRYYRDDFNKEPWYEFSLGTFKIVIGPRKSVISMSLIRHNEPYDPSALAALGNRDDVTYVTEHESETVPDLVRNATIHAWGKDKTIEYLRVMLDLIARVDA